jgi:hypothetical protein
MIVSLNNDDELRHAPSHQPSSHMTCQCIGWRIVPDFLAVPCRKLQHRAAAGGTRSRHLRLLSWNRATGYVPPRFDRPPSGVFSMTITTAHIPAIVALIAGILILLMPRILNLVVAIYLIFVGLVGLGVLKMFHLG